MLLPCPCMCFQHKRHDWSDRIFLLAIHKFRSVRPHQGKRFLCLSKWNQVDFVFVVEDYDLRLVGEPWPSSKLTILLLKHDCFLAEEAQPLFMDLSFQASLDDHRVRLPNVTSWSGAIECKNVGHALRFGGFTWCHTSGSYPITDHRFYHVSKTLYYTHN